MHRSTGAVSTALGNRRQGRELVVPELALAPHRSHRGRPAVRVPRERELEQVRDAILARRSVLVFGDAGVGKTYLVDAVEEATSEAGFTWLGVTTGATDATSPFSTLAPIFPELLAGDPDMSLSTRMSLVIAVVRARAAGCTLVVRVDDAHHLDELSRTALVWLARAGEIVMVATMRHASASRSPWLELWKDGVADRVDVLPFSRVQTERYLQGLLDGVVTSEVAFHVVERSAGNAFFVGELLRTALDSGVVRQVGDVWVWDGEPPLGDRVPDLVRHELMGISDEERALMEAVAVLGEIDAAVVESFASREAVDRLIDLHLLRMRPAGPDRLGVTSPAAVTCHPMYGRTLREAVSAARRTEVRRTWETVASGARPSSDALLVAVLDALEHGVDQPVETICETVRSALALHRCEYVVRVVSLGLGAVPQDAPQRVELLALRAQAWLYLARPAHAQRDVAAAYAALEEVRHGDTVLGAVTRLARIEADVAQFVHDDVDRAMSVLDGLEGRAARTGAILDDAWRVDQEIDRLTRLAHAGRPEQMLVRFGELAAECQGSEERVLPIVPAMVVALVQHGNGTMALGLVEHYMTIASAHADGAPWAISDIATAGFLAAGLMGYLTPAEEFMGIFDADALPFNVDLAGVSMAKGVVSMQTGRWAQARAELHASSSRYGFADVQGRLALSLALEGVAAAAAGEQRAARQLLDRAAGAPRPGVRSLEGYQRLLRLDALAWLHDPAVVDEALSLAAWCEERAMARVGLEALHRAAIGEHARGNGAAVTRIVDRALATGAGLDGPRATEIVAHLRALADGDTALALGAVQRLTAVGLWLPADTAAVQLTRREAEIASLAAAGLSSKEIAARLTLSVRTVDSHLSRIFTKAGVRNRRELATVLHLEQP